MAVAYGDGVARAVGRCSRARSVADRRRPGVHARLADLGADVIKIESPNGDLSRTVPPFVEGIGAVYAELNAGKQSVCIDIRTPEGADLVARLAEHSDIFVENYRPGALAGRGLGYDALAARNPRLIYLSISGFGQEGPWAARRGHAPLLHAEAGTMEVAAASSGRRARAGGASAR